VSGSKFSVHIALDTILTLSSTTGQNKLYGGVPAFEPFHVPYKDDFES